VLLSLTGDKHHGELDDATARRLLAVTGQRVVLELRGLSCLALEELTPPKKAICCAKGFGSPLATLDELGEPLSAYLSRVAEKLRAQRQLAGFLQVFLETNPHGGGPQYCPATGCALPMPSNDSGHLAGIAAGLLRRIHRPGFSFRKVGVLASDLGPDSPCCRGAGSATKTPSRFAWRVSTSGTFTPPTSCSRPKACPCRSTSSSPARPLASPYPPAASFYLAAGTFYPPARTFYRPAASFYPADRTFHPPHERFSCEGSKKGIVPEVQQKSVPLGARIGFGPTGKQRALRRR
jgi:hypothetical protein